jgi:hypothetical protein
MEDKRKGSMQSIGMWSLKTESHAVHGVLWIWNMWRNHDCENCWPRTEYIGSPWVRVLERPG